MAERFWSNVNMKGPLVRPKLGWCWVWVGTKISGRYGGIGVNGKSGVLAHRVSWFLYKGKWPKKFVLHKCDNGFCVRPSHLFQGTQTDNMKDMVKKGRKVNNPNRGESNTTSKLTNRKVLSIRALYKSGKYTQLSLAEKFKVEQTNISFIVRNKTWRHVHEQDR